MGSATNKPRPLVLVHPASRKRVYQSLAADLAAIEPPVWAGMMASYVRARGFGVELVDAEAEELSAEETARRIIELKPALAAVVAYGQQPSASTQVMPAAGAVCAAIKELDPAVPVLLLGGHVAALPARTLNEERADYTCDGEGLVTLVELMQALSGVGPDVTRVSDLYYRADGGVTRSVTRAPLVAELPDVAWDLLPMERYRAHNWHCLGGLERSPYAALYTTLGCPYRCAFCCIQAPFRSGEAALGMRPGTNSYRFTDPRRVVDNLEHLSTRYGVRNVKIADEMFVLNRRHVGAVCDLIVGRGLDLNLWAYARIDTVSPQLLAKLEGAGFRWLAFGIEAASSAVRDDVEKGFPQERIFRTLDSVRQAGIHAIGNYIFGLPEDDLETMRQTLDLAMELNCEFGNFYCAMAYPGSPLYERALARGWELPSSWSGYSQHAYDSRPLPTNHLSSSEVLRFRDEAFLTYYRNPRYLERIEAEFGPDTVRHIREMTSHKLERKY